MIISRFMIISVDRKDLKEILGILESSKMSEKSDSYRDPNDDDGHVLGLVCAVQAAREHNVVVERLIKRLKKAIKEAE